MRCPGRSSGTGCNTIGEVVGAMGRPGSSSVDKYNIGPAEPYAIQGAVGQYGTVAPGMGGPAGQYAVQGAVGDGASCQGHATIGRGGGARPTLFPALRTYVAAANGIQCEGELRGANSTKMHNGGAKDMPEPNSEEVQGSSSFICSAASANGDDIGSDDFVRDDEAESQEQVCGVTPQDPPSAALGWGLRKLGKVLLAKLYPGVRPLPLLAGGLRIPGMIEMLMARVLIGGGTASPPGDPRPYYDALVGQVRSTRPAGAESRRRRQLCEDSANQVCSKEEGRTRRTNHATRRRAKNGELRDDIAAPADKLATLRAMILKARSKAAKLKTTYDWHNFEVAEKYDVGMRYYSRLKPAWDAYTAAKEDLEHAYAVEDEASWEMLKVHELLGTRMPVLYMSNKVLSGECR